MADIELPMLYANAADGALVFVDDVATGAACGCTCPACDQPLIAKNAGHKVMHHFAHRTQTCAWALEHVLSAMASEVIARVGTIALPALAYEDALTGQAEPLSPSRTLRVAEVSLASVSGRGAPDLMVSCVAGSKRRTFALVVSLTHRLRDEEADALAAASSGVVLVDLARDLRRRRREEGRHYDRAEIVVTYQDPAFVAGVLASPSTDLKAWARNARADEAHARSVRERDRRREEERKKREEERRQRELERAEQERERRERKQREEAERDEWLKRAEEEVAADEVGRELAERLRGGARKEVPADPYDISCWEPIDYTEGGVLLERCPYRAYAEGDGPVTLLCPLKATCVRDVAQHVGELARDRALTVVLTAEEAWRNDAIEVRRHAGELVVRLKDASAAACVEAIRSLQDAGLAVRVALGRGFGGMLVAADEEGVLRVRRG